MTKRRGTIHQTLAGLVSQGTLLSAVLLLAVSTTACSKSDTAATASAVPAVPVKLQTLGSAAVEDSSEFVGSLEAATKADIKPEIQGQIQQIAVQPGARVGKGMVLLSLKPDQTAPQVGVAASQVNGAIAARNTAVQQLQVAQANLSTAQSDLQLKQTNLSRAQYLLGQGAIAQYTYDQAVQQTQAAQNAVTASQEMVESARSGIAQADAAVQQARSQAEAAQVSLDFKQIVAPIAGVMGDLTVKVGDYVTTGQTIGSITNNEVLLLRSTVPSNRAAELRPGLPVQLIDPNTKQVLTTGSVDFISPTVDSNVQGTLIKSRFANSNGALRDGQYVTARLIWDKQPGLLIPSTAITRIGGQSFVFVAATETTPEGDKQVVRQQPITLGPMQGQSYQVVEGLKAGDQIAVSNILRLKDGAPIQPDP